MSSSLKALLPLGLFAALAVFLAVGLRTDPSILPSQLIDRPLPEFESETLDGAAIARADIVGQPALINVFGSWCVACLVEHPLLMENADTVQLIGVNWRDTRPKARAWLDRHGDPYDLVIFDPNSRLAIDLGITGAPETFVVDAAGRIRYKHSGVITAEIWGDTLMPLLRSLEDQTG